MKYCPKTFTFSAVVARTREQNIGVKKVVNAFLEYKVESMPRKELKR